MDSDAGGELFRRRGRTWTADGFAYRRRYANGHAGFVARGEKSVAVLFADAVPASRFVRYVHRAEFLPLVHFLGTEFDPGVLPCAALGWIGARSRCNTILHLHYGRQRGDAAGVSRDLPG